MACECGKRGISEELKPLLGLKGPTIEKRLPPGAANTKEASIKMLASEAQGRTLRRDSLAQYTALPARLLRAGYYL
jgi:hypothetical protein